VTCHKSSAGQISTALWDNEVTTQAGKKVTLLQATVERRCKDGQWKSSNGFNRNEIPLITSCLQKSFEHIIGSRQGEEAEGGSRQRG